jgi:ferredoxin
MNKIILERNKCIGCGTCAVLCPTFFEMSDDGRVDLIDAEVVGDNMEKEVSDVSCNEEAAQGCPMQCIQIKDN